MKIAVIGSGISGLSASYYLSKKYIVDLFEKEDHFGGHSHTIDLEYEKDNRKKTSVDIGFIVFNYLTYPNLINFFKENKIQIEKSNMSYSVSVKNANIEYCGKGINGISSNKFWPPVARVDNVYGDKNLFCSCPSMDEFKEDAA